MKKNKLCLILILAVSLAAVFLFIFYNRNESNQDETVDETGLLIQEKKEILSDLKIGYITDAHCYGKWKKDGTWETNWRCKQPMEKFIEQMNGSFEPDIIIDGGDLSDGRDDETAKVLKIARKMLDELESPTYHVMGNHEARDLRKAEWLEIVGYKKTYYAFDVKNYRIIVLDGNFAPTNRASKDISSLEDIGPDVKDFYPGVVSSEQISWLKKTLKQAEDKQKIVFIHQPVLEETLIKDRSNLLTNAEILRGIFEENNVRAVFSGHIEETCVVSEGGVSYYTLPGFHKGNKYIEDAKDKPVFSELIFSRDDLEVKMYQSSNRGETFESISLNSSTVKCNNETIEERKKTSEEIEK